MYYKLYIDSVFLLQMTSNLYLLSLAGKILLCFCMYLGRIGPISMVLVFTIRDRQIAAKLPEEHVAVG